MEVREGWATEYGKTRFDLLVGEADLQRLFAELGITPAYQVKITPSMSFLLLKTLCRWFAEAESMRLHAAGSEESKAVSDRAWQARWQHYAAVRQVLGLLGLAVPPQYQEPVSGQPAGG